MIEDETRAKVEKEAMNTLRVIMVAIQNQSQYLAAEAQAYPHNSRENLLALGTSAGLEKSRRQF
jgi:hypothetical protein